MLGIPTASSTQAPQNVALKNGASIELQTWNYRQVESYIRATMAKDPYNWIPREELPGFTYLGVSIFERGKALETSHYRDTSNLTRLEEQPRRDLKDAEYDRAIVAVDRGEVRGIAYCTWLSDSLKFWRYKIRWIDVHADSRSQGMSTVLLTAIDTAPFMHGKILQESDYSRDGSRFLKKKVSSQLHAKSYALIGASYITQQPPTEFGRYDNLGRKFE